MESLAPLLEVLARKNLKDAELYLWQELRVEFTWTGGTVTQLAARQRSACSLRRRGVLCSLDGCGREQLAALLEVKPRDLKRETWEGELALPEPRAVALALPPQPLAVGVTASRALVVRGDGAFAATRKPVVDAKNAAGETFTWVWGQPAPDLAEAQTGTALPPARGFRAVLRPQAAAVLCHELFGHPLEADSFFSGDSPWAGRLGTRVTPAPLHVIDDPTRELPGGFLHDDEGEPARPKALVAAGVLAGILADRSYAACFRVEAGNARRADPHHVPAPRLSNLVAWVDNGDPEPPLREARVEIVRVRSGLYVPAQRALLLAVSESYLLSRGTRRERLVPFFLKLPVAASGFRILAGGGHPQPVAEPGWCGKKHQLLPVGAAAGWLLLDRVEAA